VGVQYYKVINTATTFFIFRNYQEVHMKRIRFIAIILLAASLITGCDAINLFTQTVEGSGEVVIEKRDLPEFNKIEARGDFELYVTQLNTGVEVHAEDNLMKYVQTYVQDQTLFVEIVDTDGSNINLMPLEPIRVYVKLVRIKGIVLAEGAELTSSQLVAEDAEINLSLSGGSVGYINAIRTGKLDVNLSGGSELTIRDGQVAEQTITASGVSNYIAERVKSEITAINLSGGSESTIWAEDTFELALSGGSMAYYYGSPVNLTELENSGGSDYISKGER
jgi:hypothetical protein